RLARGRGAKRVGFAESDEAGSFGMARNAALEADRPERVGGAFGRADDGEAPPQKRGHPRGAARKVKALSPGDWAHALYREWGAVTTLNHGRDGDEGRQRRVLCGGGWGRPPKRGGSRPPPDRPRFRRLEGHRRA